MHLMLFAPELVLIAGSLAVFAISLGTGRARLAALVTISTALAALAVCAATLGWQGELFFRTYRVDLFSQLFKLFTLLGLAAVVIFGRQLKDVRDDARPEYFLFLLLGTFGLLMLVSSIELITLFIALELSSYALYLLVPLRQERTGLRTQMESAAKYVMFGIVATGVLLFGMSYLFGLSGSSFFRDIGPALACHWGDPAAVVGMTLVLAGLFFKLAAFPMQLWAPDVYQGASNETTAFIATVPKVGVVAVLIRFLLCATPADQVLTTVLMVAAVCSMFLGNLAALVQQDVKRMLGYSSIAHAGYVLIGLVTLRDAGYAASMYYIFGFVSMSLGGFLVLCHVSRDGENVTVEDLAGLHMRSPLAALMLGVSMFSLAGIPPFVGFMGKFLLLAEALRGGFVILVVLAALNTAIGIYYYLNIVRVMYFSEAGGRPAVRLDALTTAIGVVLLLLTLLLGILPAHLLDKALAALRAAILWK
jgi:NADH-quinone oxidoreductase subunit N